MERKGTVTYRMMNLLTNKIGIAPDEEVKEALVEIWKEVVFYTRGGRYGAN